MHRSSLNLNRIFLQTPLGVDLYPMLPLYTALAVLLFTALAEWLHARRIRAVGRLAFGPASQARAWTRLVPWLRPLAFAAFAWGLAVMVDLHFAEQDGKSESANLSRAF